MLRKQSSFHPSKRIRENIRTGSPERDKEGGRRESSFWLDIIKLEYLGTKQESPADEDDDNALSV